MKQDKKKTITEVIKFLKANPEFGRAFHEYFEDMRDELIAAKWTRVDPQFDKKCHIAAEFIQSKILNDFGLKPLSRRD